jgi:hypothetical protein
MLNLHYPCADPPPYRMDHIPDSHVELGPCTRTRAAQITWPPSSRAHRSLSDRDESMGTTQSTPGPHHVTLVVVELQIS